VKKRYVFWRTPTGKPYEGKDDKYGPTASLADLGLTASVNMEGRPAFDSFRLMQVEPVIRAAVVVRDTEGNELNEQDAWSIVWSAIGLVIKKSGGGRPVIPSVLLQEADALAAKHSRRPFNRYFLVTSLSLKSFPIHGVSVRQCEISVLKSRRHFPVPEGLKKHAHHRRIAQHVDKTSYLWVRVKTLGRTIHEAAQNALDAMDILRGTWTLLATYRSWSFNLGGPRIEPIGVIHRGPVHTLHNPDGQPIDFAYWSDSNYVEDQKIFQPPQGWEPIEKGRRTLMRRVKRLEYKEDLEDVIIRYVSALDNTDLDLAFLQMWSILERITDTVGQSYDETIRRAIWVFDERSIVKERLEAMRFRRNSFVHAAQSTADRDQITYHLKSIVEPHLVMLIHNGFGVRNFEEYGRFLALPTDIMTLKEKRRQYGRAMRLRTKWGLAK
jgi:hypothetical protein